MNNPDTAIKTVNGSEPGKASNFRRERIPTSLRNIYLFFQGCFAPKRFRLLYRSLGLDGHTRVLDLGGTSQYWNLAQRLGFPVPRVTIVNTTDPEDSTSNRLSWVKADARRVPFKDFAFDAVVSNSLIEHLGDYGSQQEFANEVRRLAPNYFVQTPNRNFPVEPHFLGPSVHWLPKSVQRATIRNLTLYGILSRPSPREVEEFLSELRLLTRRDMDNLFSGAHIISEKWLGMNKSIIACSAQSRHE
ncbi:MAG: methyltransferase domain-containing protein [Candidatus Acidiferrales bacterium]